MMKQSYTSPFLSSLEEELEKLYQRRILIENLIDSLERYSATPRMPSEQAGLATVHAAGFQQMAS